jgi:hypothetical protein
MVVLASVAAISASPTFPKRPCLSYQRESRLICPAEAAADMGLIGH